MDYDQLGILRLTDVGASISLDSRLTPTGTDVPHGVVKGTLVGVRHYLDRDTGQKRTRLEVRTFGEHVTVLEFVDGQLHQPVTPDDQPGIPTIH